MHQESRKELRPYCWAITRGTRTCVRGGICVPRSYTKTIFFQVNSAIVPTKVLSDPMELERTLQSGLLQSAAAATNGFAFDPAAAAMAAAAAAAAAASESSSAAAAAALAENVAALKVRDFCFT